MAWCNPPPFAEAVLAEATRLSATRRTSSDGICGDRAHQQSVSDHNPDARGVPHAVDVSQSTPGAPFWETRFGVFDAHALAREVARRRDPRVEYMVIGQPNGPDIIWSHDHDWRQNGSYKTDHRSHLHVSFTVAAENSTAPFFGAPEEDDMTPDEFHDLMVGNDGKAGPGTYIGRIKSDTSAVVEKRLEELVPDLVEAAVKKYVEDKLGGYVNGVWKPDALADKVLPAARVVNGLTKAASG